MSNPSSKPSDASPVKIEAPKELPKLSLVNESLKKLKFHLARFDNMVKIRTTPDARTEEILEFFENNDLKAQLQDKDNTICKLKDIVKSMREKSKEENVKYDYCDIETKNVELANSVAKLLSENKRLCNEINHVKQLDLESFAHRLLQNRKAHIDYLKYTQEQADILQGIVKQAKAEQPLDKELEFAFRFRNDHIARIMGYGDYQLGNVTISRVYYVEGLGHNLFSVGKFCDADLEVAFQKNTCFIRNLEGVDLISRSQDIILYIISLDDMRKTSSICLLSKASKTKSWLWHRHLSHLNFGTLNKLAKDGLARGIPRHKFHKDHLCSACALGKSKKSSHQPKAEDTNQEKLYILHMDLCGPMRVASINGKRYISVIVDDYSRFTWVRFLRTKDEDLEAIIKCIKNIQVRLNATVRNLRTEKGTEFVNQTQCKFYENVSISHQTSVARTPQKNGVVKSCNTPKIGSQWNVFPGALLHDPIAKVRREWPLTESFEKKSCKFGLQCTS
ncbi:retrovirus-related pol polyprotein from transposon TNT 1-94, partial [Tanacetum coccineum]